MAFESQDPKSPTVWILDYSHCGLLDGHGKPLPQGAEPVYVEVLRADLEAGTVKNSAGEFFAKALPEAVNLGAT